MEIKTVGVVGCGLMGSGIAQVSAQSGYNVVTSEINETLLEKGLSSIKFALNIDVRRRRITQADMDAIIGRIKGTTNYADFANCDLVIEAAPETMDIKKGISLSLQGSGIPVDRITDVGICTFCEAARFPSYRHDKRSGATGENCGRIYNFLLLKPGRKTKNREQENACSP